MHSELTGEPTPQSRPQRDKDRRLRRRETASGPAPCCVYPLFPQSYRKRGKRRAEKRSAFRVQPSPVGAFLVRICGH
jgi:hypothetical protein